MKTLFIDIDGTLLYHYNIVNKQPSLTPVLLPGVEAKLGEWEEKGYRIILTTCRKESERQLTEQQLNAVGIRYDQLLMGLVRGERVLINDIKTESSEPTAIAINVIRNNGFNDIDI